MGLLGLHAFTWLGLLLIAAGTLFTIIGQSRKNEMEMKAKEKRIDSLQKSNEDFIIEKDGMLARINKLTEEKSSYESELKEKDKEIEDNGRKDDPPLTVENSRSIPAAMAVKIVNELKKYAGKKEVYVYIPKDKTEPKQFGKKLENLFTSAGWKHKYEVETGTATGLSKGSTGVIIYTNMENYGIAQFLKGQLNAIEYQCTLETYSDDQLEIWVYEK